MTAITFPSSSHRCAEQMIEKPVRSERRAIVPAKTASYIISSPETMSSAEDEAALAKVYRPDTAVNLSPPDNAAMHISSEIQQYIVDQLGLV